MQTLENRDIQEIPLSSPTFRRRVEAFLAANGLRFEGVDSYYALMDEDGKIVAGAGLRRDVVKCVAVDSSVRSGGLMAPLVSHVINVAASQGITNLKVFTKPENESIFASLGFHSIARAPRAVLMENGRGLEEYLDSVGAGQPSGHGRVHPRFAPAGIGIIVMNANPFTLGHEYLVRKASEEVDRLFVIPVKEDLSLFPYEERLEMIRRGCDGVATVLEGSDYQISETTFPTYFLKDLSEASETQMRLDLDLFGRHIAPALGASVRFVGSEPSDPLTARYNELMKEVLPSYGIRVVEIPRQPISASSVRKALAEGSFHAAASLCPPTTWPYLVGELMARALKLELDTPLKPGLVDPESTGAHSDMDYSLMLGSIRTIRSSFVRHYPHIMNYLGQKGAASEDTATLGTLRGGTGAERSEASGGAERSEASERRHLSGEISAFGKEIEADVLEYTGGVNTYRGAIFALGLTAVAALMVGSIRENIVVLASGIPSAEGSHGASAVKEYGVKGALQMAREGYAPLFEDWLPFYRESTMQKTLLRIMSTLDDTCVIHRVGYKRAQEVKDEVKALLENFSVEGLEEMKRKYDFEGISPGGAADMLALTIFADSLLK